MLLGRGWLPYVSGLWAGPAWQLATVLWRLSLRSVYTPIVGHGSAHPYSVAAQQDHVIVFLFSVFFSSKNQTMVAFLKFSKVEQISKIGINFKTEQISNWNKIYIF
jgi:hypothetical protein